MIFNLGTTLGQSARQRDGRAWECLPQSSSRSMRSTLGDMSIRSAVPDFPSNGESSSNGLPEKLSVREKSSDWTSVPRRSTGPELVKAVHPSTSVSEDG